MQIKYYPIYLKIYTFTYITLIKNNIELVNFAKIYTFEENFKYTR